jgi:hypothetical protein
VEAEVEAEAKMKAEVEAKREAKWKAMETEIEHRIRQKMEQKKELFEAMMMRDERPKYRRAFDWAVKMGHANVVELLIYRDYIVDLNKASNVRGLLNNADVKPYGCSQTPLGLAVLSGHFEVVKCLCEAQKGGLRTDAKPEKGKSALQIAFEVSRCRPSANYRLDPKTYEIWEYIMKRGDSRRELKRLNEERRGHLDAINAFLVGTALIATGTFAGWLSPPLGYSSPPGTDGPFASVEGHPILEKFWVFNSLSFFFAIATFMVGANVSFPHQKTFTSETWCTLYGGNFD